MARPLLEILLSLAVGPLPPTLSYVLGGSDDLLSFASGRLCCWLVFYLAIIGFYHTACPAIRWYCRRRWPKAPTSNLDQRLVDNMVEVSLQAFPLYVMVPVLVLMHVEAAALERTSPPTAVTPATPATPATRASFRRQERHLRQQLAVLALSAETRALSPWTMGLPFLVGQVWLAVIIHHGARSFDDDL